MLLETLQAATVQVTPAIVLLWIAGRYLSPKVQVWLWRLVFIRLTIGLFLWPSVDVAVLPGEPMAYADASVAAAPVSQPFPIWQAAWLVGVSLLTLVSLKETWSVRRLVREADRQPFAPSPTSSAYQISDRAKAPMVIGLFRPTILIPRAIAESSTPEEIRMIVGHEEGHIAHRDLIWGWLVWAGRAIFFFHPLVWIAARCERFAREAAADRYAIEKAGVDPHGYGQVLVRITIADSQRLSLSPAGLTMSESYRFVYRRLETMKQFSKRPTLGRLISTAALCAVTCGLLPAFNLIPAVAQAAPLDGLEPMAFPSGDVQASVPQPVVILREQSHPAQTAKKAARTASIKIIDRKSPSRPAHSSAQTPARPSVPRPATAPRAVPSTPAVPSAPLPASAPAPRPAQVLPSIPAPASPAEVSRAVPGVPGAIRPTQAPPALDPSQVGAQVPPILAPAAPAAPVPTVPAQPAPRAIYQSGGGRPALVPAPAAPRFQTIQPAHVLTIVRTPQTMRPLFITTIQTTSLTTTRINLKLSPVQRTALSKGQAVKLRKVISVPLRITLLPSKK